MFFKKYSAGISFSEVSAQIAVLEVGRRDVRIRYFEEIAKQDDLPLWFLEPILSRSSRIYKKVKKVSLALPGDSVLVHLFPLDSSLNQDAQDNQVDWELGHLIPSYQSKEYVKDVHILKTSSRDQTQEVMVVAARRAAIAAIQEKLQAHKYEMHIIDLDHFGAEYALFVNYPETRTKCVGLATVASNRIDLGVLNNSRLAEYRYRLTESTEETLEFLQQRIADTGLTDLFFHGPNAAHTLINTARQRFKINCAMLNPLKELKPSRAFREIDSFTGHEFRYAAAIGCALRKQ